jgi:hypothetical protein
LLLVERLLRHRFGPRSEKLDLDQLRLGLEDEELPTIQSASRGNPRLPAALRGLPATPDEWLTTNL